MVLTRNSKMSDIISKVVAPTKHVTGYPFGQMWRHYHEDTVGEYYIQLSQNPDEPKWIPIGFFLKEVFNKELESDAFIKECLHKYQSSNKN